MSEPASARLKRLHMRSWRRGTKEMDLILGGFAQARLRELDEAGLASYDQLLNENDHDLYQWLTAQLPPPPALKLIVDLVASVAKTR